MTNRTRISKKLEKKASAAEQSWWIIFMRHPLKLLRAQASHFLVWPFFKKGFLAKAKPFYGGRLWVRLPAGKDIFITSCKKDPADNKLAQWMIDQVRTGWKVVDAGAQFGYFTLLLQQLVGSSGKVAAFEPAPLAYDILEKNVVDEKNIIVYNVGLSYDVGKHLLADRGVKASHRNSFYHLSKSHTKLVPVTSLDAWVIDGGWVPDLIRIDVEGWEWNVVRGGMELLQRNKPILALTIATHHFEKVYYPAIDWLLANGYRMYSLSSDGQLLRCLDAWSELQRNHLYRDNFIFFPKSR